MILVFGVWAFVRALLGHSATVSLENVVLRHQLAVLQRSVGRPRLLRRDPTPLSQEGVGDVTSAPMNPGKINASVTIIRVAPAGATPITATQVIMSPSNTGSPSMT